MSASAVTTSGPAGRAGTASPAQLLWHPGKPGCPPAHARKNFVMT